MTSEESTQPSSGSEAEANPQATDYEKQAWPAAFGTLVSSRFAIASAEAKLAVGSTAKKAVFAVVAALAALFFYLTLLAGLIGLFASLSSALDWYHVALIIAGVHLLVVIIAALLMMKKTPPTFSLTRTEFEKDRQWLKNQKNPNSQS